MKVESDFVRSSQDGKKIAIDVYIRPSKTPQPVIILAHGIGAVKALGLQAFAGQFYDAGYSAITLDYRYFGDSEGTPRNMMSIPAQLQDFKDVIAWVRRQPDKFDAKKIVAWGTSFGGMHITTLMSTDHELAAGIMQCPCVDAFKAMLKVPIFHSLRLLPYAVADLVLSYFSRGPVYVKLIRDSKSDRSPALMPGDAAVDGFRRLEKSADNLKDSQNILTASSVLAFPLHRPVFQLTKSVKPLLVVLPTSDEEAPLDSAEHAVKLAPFGEAWRVPGGHFDLYRGGIAYEQNLKGQLAFLQRVLG